MIKSIGILIYEFIDPIYKFKFNFMNDLFTKNIKGGFNHLITKIKKKMNNKTIQLLIENATRKMKNSEENILWLSLAISLSIYSEGTMSL